MKYLIITFSLNEGIAGKQDPKPDYCEKSHPESLIRQSHT